MHVMSFLNFNFDRFIDWTHLAIAYELQNNQKMFNFMKNFPMMQIWKIENYYSPNLPHVSIGIKMNKQQLKFSNKKIIWSLTAFIFIYGNQQLLNVQKSNERVPFQPLQFQVLTINYRLMKLSYFQMMKMVTEKSSLFSAIAETLICKPASNPAVRHSYRVEV